MEREIQSLKDRNKIVETNKAWETSFTRRAFISLATFIVASIWLRIINEDHFLLKALVPVAGYVLSTISIPVLKRFWMRQREVTGKPN